MLVRVFLGLRYGAALFRCSDASLFRLYAGMGLVGSLLSGHPACKAMAVSTKGVASRCDFVLLLGDSFFYPAVVLTTAILASWTCLV